MESAPDLVTSNSDEDRMKLDRNLQTLKKRTLRAMAEIQRRISGAEKKFAEISVLSDNNQEGQNSSAGSHEDTQTAELPKDSENTPDESPQRKDIEEKEYCPRDHKMAEKIGGTSKGRKVKPDLRNKAERTNLTFGGAWIIKSLLLMYKSTMPRFWITLMTFICLVNLGSCSENVTVLERHAKVGQPVTLQAPVVDELAPIREWLFSGINDSQAKTICTLIQPEEISSATNSSCPDVHCSSDGQLLISRATRCHQGMYLFNSYYSSGAETDAKYQLTIDEETTTAEPEAETPTSVYTELMDGNNGRELTVRLTAALCTAVIAAVVSLGVLLCYCCKSKNTLGPKDYTAVYLQETRNSNIPQTEASRHLTSA